jgi:hypothetical protein
MFENLNIDTKIQSLFTRDIQIAVVTNAETTKGQSIQESDVEETPTIHIKETPIKETLTTLPIESPVDDIVVDNIVVDNPIQPITTPVEQTLSITTPVEQTRRQYAKQLITRNERTVFVGNLPISTTEKVS